MLLRGFDKTVKFIVNFLFLEYDYFCQPYKLCLLKKRRKQSSNYQNLGTILKAILEKCNQLQLNNFRIKGFGGFPNF